MRLTNALLQEYIEMEMAIKKMEKVKAEIRLAILEREESEFTMGDFFISKKEIARTIPIRVEEIREILGDKAEEILKESKSVRVDVKKVSQGDFMKYLYCIMFLLSSDVIADDWICNEMSSERRGNEIAACGVADGQDENMARSEAYINAKSEFDRVCDASSDCKDHAVTIEPRRTSCNKIIDGFRCYRLLAFYIGRPVAHKVDPEEQQAKYEKRFNAMVEAEVKRQGF